MAQATTAPPCFKRSIAAALLTRSLARPPIPCFTGAFACLLVVPQACTCIADLSLLSVHACSSELLPPDSLPSLPPKTAQSRICTLAQARIPIPLLPHLLISFFFGTRSLPWPPCSMGAAFCTTCEKHAQSPAPVLGTGGFAWHAPPNIAGGQESGSTTQLWTLGPDCGPFEKGAGTPRMVACGAAGGSGGQPSSHDVRTCAARGSGSEVSRPSSAVQRCCGARQSLQVSRGVSGFAAGTRGPPLGRTGEWVAMCTHLEAPKAGRPHKRDASRPHPVQPRVRRPNSRPPGLPRVPELKSRLRRRSLASAISTAGAAGCSTAAAAAAPLHSLALARDGAPETAAGSAAGAAGGGGLPGAAVRSQAPAASRRPAPT